MAGVGAFVRRCFLGGRATTLARVCACAAACGGRRVLDGVKINLKSLGAGACAAACGGCLILGGVNFVGNRRVQRRMSKFEMLAG